MKRLLLSIVSAVCMFTCFALDTIHLNNGRVVTGTITQIEEGVSITIMMENGKIAAEGDPEEVSKAYLALWK